MTIHVQIKLFATLAKFLPRSADRYEVAQETTVGEILSQLGIPEKDAKLIFVNGVRRDAATMLRHGDRIGIFPPVGGG